MTAFLAELEEYVSSFITHVAQIQKQDDYHISALGLDTIPNKEFEKGPMQIDNLPNSNFFKDGFDEEQTTEDDVITNKRDLYRKF